jgi:hypothetical protein
VRKEEFYRELERLILYEEVSWGQKFRAPWLREGDKNTVFSLGAKFE